MAKGAGRIPPDHHGGDGESLVMAFHGRTRRFRWLSVSEQGRSQYSGNERKMGRGLSRPIEVNIIEVNIEEFLADEAIVFGRRRPPYRHQSRFRSPGGCPLRPGQTEW